ncbi:polymer-forming cytoskeletal protein [bacterium]|nr:polymer-forming cytoskeletal protein [bacterium]
MSFFKKSKTGEQPKPDNIVKTGEFSIKDQKTKEFPEPAREPERESAPDKDKSQNPKLFSPFLKKSTEGKNSQAPPASKTTIGKTVVVTGEISGGEEVFIEGRVDGDIVVLNRIGVGITGKVEGKIEAQEIKISGKVLGDITAINKLEVAATGDISGRISSPRIIVSEGATLEGAMTTSRGRALIKDRTQGQSELAPSLQTLDQNNVVSVTDTNISAQPGPSMEPVPGPEPENTQSESNDQDGPGPDTDNQKSNSLSDAGPNNEQLPLNVIDPPFSSNHHNKKKHKRR